MPQQILLSFVLSASLLACAASAPGTTVNFSTPQINRWMYPFSNDPGRWTASTFGAIGEEDFDDHDAQVLLGFDTTTGTTPVPTGLGASKYSVTAATVTMTVASGSFTYDPTYDGYQTYLTTGGTADSDPGRPVELYGLGFRGGYTKLALGEDNNAPPGFEEGTAFGTAEGRFAYPISYTGAGVALDASDNVSNALENSPFAIGSVTGMNPGALIAKGTTLTFSLNVSDPFIQSYLQQGLNDGLLGFGAASLHDASQFGPIVYPNFYTRQSLAAGAIAPTFSLSYDIVTQPAPFPGDANGDHVVNFSDLSILLLHYNQAGTFSTGDFDNSGTVNFSDLSILLLHYNQTAPQSASLTAAVPEPGSLVLAALAVGLAFCLRRPLTGRRSRQPTACPN